MLSCIHPDASLAPSISLPPTPPLLSRVSSSQAQAVRASKRKEYKKKKNPKMVKLTSVRSTRCYGYPEPLNDIAELVNALIYLVATTLLLSALAFDLNRDHPGVVPWLLMISALLLAAVNIHDLIAQLAGFDFRLPLLTVDPQLALVEALAPILHTIGFLLAFGGFLTLHIAGDKDYSSDVERSGRESLLAGLVLLLIGSILNNFQVYERLDLVSQAEQHAVSIPMTLGSLLLLISAVVGLVQWPKPALGQATDLSRWLALSAGILWFVSALINVDRVLRVQESDAIGRVEPLRRGAAEVLEAAREQGTPLMEAPRVETAPAARRTPPRDVEKGQHADARAEVGQKAGFQPAERPWAG